MQPGTYEQPILPQGVTQQGSHVYPTDQQTYYQQPGQVQTQVPTYQFPNQQVVQSSPVRQYQIPVTQTQPVQYQPVQAQTYYQPTPNQQNQVLQRSAQNLPSGRDLQVSPKKYYPPAGQASYSGKAMYPVKQGVESFSLWDWLKYLIPLLFALFALACCIFLLCSHESMTPNETAAKQVLLKAKKNLDAVPFTNLKVKEHDKACDDEYEEVEVGQWPGVNSGCICEEENGTHTPHHMTYCTIHPFKCEHVFGIDPVSIKKFSVKDKAGTAKNYHICGMRDTAPLQVSESCSGEWDEEAGPELCSQNPVLNHIESVKPKSNKRKYHLTETEQTINLQNESWKLKNNGNSNLPLVGFELVSGSNSKTVSCWREDQQGATNSGKWYKLSTVSQQGCLQNPGEKEEADSDRDEDQIKLDEQIEGQFQNQEGANKEESADELNNNENNFVDLGHKQNLLKTYKATIPQSDLDDLEYFDNSYGQNDQLNLIMNRRLYINGRVEKCKQIDTEHMNWIHEDSETLKHVTISWSIILIVICAAIILIFVLFFALNKLYSPFAYRFMWILFAIGVILAIIFGAIYYVYKYRPNGLENLQDRYSQYEKDQCFDENSRPVGLAAKTMSVYARSTYENQETPTLWLFYGSIVFAVIGILYAIYMMASGKGF